MGGYGGCFFFLPLMSIVLHDLNVLLAEWQLEQPMVLDSLTTPRRNRLPTGALSMWEVSIGSDGGEWS